MPPEARAFLFLQGSADAALLEVHGRIPGTGGFTFHSPALPDGPGFFLYLPYNDSAADPNVR